MTQPPTFYPQYPMPPAYNANVRPTSVTVLAVLGIIFGAMRTLCTPLGVVPLLISGGPPNAVIDTYKHGGDFPMQPPYSPPYSQ